MGVDDNGTDSRNVIIVSFGEVNLNFGLDISGFGAVSVEFMSNQKFD